MKAGIESEKLVIVKKVSQFALDKMMHHYETVSKFSRAGNDVMCTGSFRRSFGIPCGHVVKSKMEKCMELNIDDFHPQWHLEKNPLCSSPDNDRIPVEIT